MDNNVQKVKEATDIVDFIGKYLELKRAGANYKALCPFHDEKTASFMVSPERQSYKCFGCDESGDVIEFAMKMEHLNFPEALKMLADRAGVSLEKFVGKKQGEENLTEGVDKNRLYQLNKSLSDFFIQQLAKSPLANKAKSFLKKRGISFSCQQTFQVGYAPDRGAISQFLRQQGYNKKEISAVGSPERLANRISFPISDPIGNIVGFTARALQDKQLPKYLNTPETKIFKKSKILYGLPQARQAIWKKGYAILVEGQMDVIASHQVGVKNTIASSGTSLTSQHLKMLSRLCSKIILALDSDSAGIKATQKIIIPALSEGLALKLVILPEGIKDAGEAIAQDATIWARALKESVYALDWVWKIKLGKRQPKDLAPEEKKSLVHELIPLLAFIKDPIEQSGWVTRLADELDIKEDVIYDRLMTPTDKSNRGNRVSVKPATAISQSNLANQPIKPTLLLLSLLTLYPKAKKEYSGVWRALREKLGKPPEAVLLEVSAKYQSFSKEQLLAEIKDIISHLKRHQTEQLKNRFARQIAQAEKAGDREKLKQLLKTLQTKINS